jgi:hypothetical protein
MGRRSLPAVRFSWPSTFTISITMTGSTTAVVTVAATAAVAAAGGERHRMSQFTAHGACFMMERDARHRPLNNRMR